MLIKKRNVKRKNAQTGKEASVIAYKKLLKQKSYELQGKQNINSL